jgi:hypothetical protein
MYTISFVQSTQLVSLGAVLVLTALFSGLTPYFSPSDGGFYTGVSGDSDDRGSGRIARDRAQSNANLPSNLVGFRGSGRIDSESEKNLHQASLNLSSPATSLSEAGGASTLLAFRGSGRITQATHIRA